MRWWVMAAVVAVSVSGLSPVFAADENGAAPEPRKNEACFFDERGYYGTAKCFAIDDDSDRRDVNSFEKPFDNSITSFKLGSGVTAQFCRDKELSGECTFGEEDEAYVTDEWTDSVSSIAVIKKGAKPKPTDDQDETPGYKYDKKDFLVSDGGNAGVPYACVYAGSSYTGQEVCLYELGSVDLRKIGFDKKTESVRVKRGIQITLCPRNAAGSECEKEIDAPLDEVSNKVLGKIAEAFVERIPAN
jgi:hypothetical protein